MLFIIENSFFREVGAYALGRNKRGSSEESSVKETVTSEFENQNSAQHMGPPCTA
jgi:hypothetical protein